MGGAAVAEVAHQLRFQNVDAMYAAIGDHHLSGEAVAARVAKLVRTAEGEREEVVSTPLRPRSRRRSRPAGVHVEGYDDVLVRMARCCTPVPGDEIMGFITRGRGVSVHRVDCANAASLADGQQERVIDVDWDADSTGDFVSLVEVKALDRPRLLQDVTSTLSEHHVNIISSQSHAGADRVAKMRFEFELSDASHLDTLLGRIRSLDSVYDAYRVVPGSDNA
ncbi:MAG: Bifunctional (p)ppGpp synthase/hydrolase relA [bacterium ADurb.Bin374]|nr:MAG: Bifunctional (p)ppGpp synthase/hydrolase relA [bacterium ADurb.Bin374]